MQNWTEAASGCQYWSDENRIHETESLAVVAQSKPK